MLNEEGIKALLPKPKTQTTVTTSPPVLEEPETTTLPPGVVPSTNPPVQNPGDRLIFDPADYTNFDTVTLPPQSISSQIDTSTQDTSAPLVNQLPEEITLPQEERPKKSRNYLIIILVAIAIAVIALIAFFTMRRKAGGGGGTPANNANVNAGNASMRSPSLNLTPQ